MRTDAMDDAQLSRRVTWLCRLLGVGGLLLIAMTWKLWTPQDVFPRVPLFAWAPPRWWDWASLAGLVAGFVGLCLPGVRWRRWSAALVAFGFAVQFLADQHRLQPWAWQFFILTVVIALADDRLVFRGWLVLVVFIYTWSAVSKCDALFQDQFGSMLLDMWMKPLEATGMKWSRTAEFWGFRAARLLARSAPLVEIAIAIMAIFVRTRRWALWLSCAMHVYLLLLLGPWGMGHQLGVLAWNLFFIGQNLLLFGNRTMRFSGWGLISDAVPAGNFGRTRRWTVEGLLVFVCLWPATEPWGVCDAWLGWAVYVPRLHKLQIRVDDVSLARLPAAFQQHKENQFNGFSSMGQDKEEREWRLIVGAVSLDVLSVPIYPDHRFTVGVALDLQERYQATEMDVDLWTRNSRWTPSYNEVDSFRTPQQIEAYVRTFRVNALPESVLRRQAANR